MGAGRRCGAVGFADGRLARAPRSSLGLLKCCRCLLHHLKHTLTAYGTGRHLCPAVPKGLFFRYVYILGVLQHTRILNVPFKIFSDA